MDLIWGRAGQTVDGWTTELEQVLNLGLNHLSLYQLTVERGTRLWRQVRDGKVVIPDEGALSDMWDATLDTTTRFGLSQYEISSFAKSEAFTSKHNLAYWTGRDYFGIGPGAHGRYFDSSTGERTRTFKVLSPDSWMTCVESTGDGTKKATRMSQREVIEELIVLGLRMNAGLDFAAVEALSHMSIWEVLDRDKVVKMEAAGFVVSTTVGLATTTKGRKVVDSLFVELLII